MSEVILLGEKWQHFTLLECLFHQVITLHWMIAVLLIQCLNLRSIRSVQAVNRARRFSGKQSHSFFLTFFAYFILGILEGIFTVFICKRLAHCHLYASALIWRVPCINISDTMVSMEVYCFCEKIANVVKCVHNFHFYGDETRNLSQWRERASKSFATKLSPHLCHRL